MRSAGVTCRGERYAPADAADGRESRAVVMAHGFGGERSWRRPAFERIVARQLAFFDRTLLP